MLIDTHAHLNFNAYKDDADEVIRRSLPRRRISNENSKEFSAINDIGNSLRGEDDGVWMINVGSQYSTSKRAVEIAEKYPEGVYAAVGLHPIHLTEGIFKTKLDKEEIAFQTKNENFDYEKYKELAQSEKVVAIGEVGLDYWYRPKTKIKLEQFKEKQRTVLCKQLNLAKELNLPVIFHCRMAHDDLIDILNRVQQGNNNAMAQKLPLAGVVHCFTGNWEQAKKYLEMGFYLGFNGIIFKLNLDEIIKKTPLDRILIETDCPYLTPPISVNQRTYQRESASTIRNEPLYVKYVAERIAKIKNLSFKEVAETTTENAKKLFEI